MEDQITKQDMQNYLSAAQSWLQQLESYVDDLASGTVDVGSNPPPPPPPPPGHGG